jgi:hypothetical protein
MIHQTCPTIIIILLVALHGVAAGRFDPGQCRVRAVR